MSLRKTLVVAGTKLVRNAEAVGHWRTEDGRYTFERVGSTTTCRAPHPTCAGFCWGDEQHPIKVWKTSQDGGPALAGDFGTLAEAVRFVTFQKASQ